MTLFGFAFLKKQKRTNRSSRSLKKVTRANCSRCSFKKSEKTICSCHYFKKSNQSESLSSLFTKTATTAICSHLSLQKERKERFTLLKRAKEGFILFCQKKMSDAQEKPKSEFPTLSV